MSVVISPIPPFPKKRGMVQTVASRKLLLLLLFPPEKEKYKGVENHKEGD